MVSIGPNSQSYNYTHMWDMTDLRVPKQELRYCHGSLMDIVSKNPDFTKFSYMAKLANMQNIFADKQANFTLFVPSDNSIRSLGDGVFMNMDQSTARNIIKGSMLNRRITSDILEDSPASYFLTTQPPNRLFVTNISNHTYINNDVNVINKNIQATNGIIHVVDKLIWPIIT